MILPCKRSHTPSFLKAVTLIELLIVVGIVLTLTAAILPSFGGFSGSQALSQSAQNFAADVRLTQGKALAGAAYGGDKDIWWGVLVCKGASGTDNSSYQLGYAANSSPDTFNDLETKALSAGVVFKNCPSDPFYFERLTGKLYGSADSIHVKISGSGKTKIVKINKGGKIEID